VESAGGTGHPLRDDLGILVDEDAHLSIPIIVPASAARRRL
jgi:hypothetical protein